ncbi:MAG: IPT/TIG domain-containing protein [Chryseolinea sp.]
MKFLYRPLARLIVLILCGFLMYACHQDDEVAPATVVAISPTMAPKAATITIAGSNFGTDSTKVSVTINDKPAKVISLTNSSIMVTVPDKAGSGSVAVTVRGAKLPDQPTFTYQLSVSTLAGNGTLGDADGAGKDAEFALLSGVLIDPGSNDVYVTDAQNCKIKRITPDGTVSSFVGRFGFVDGVKDVAAFNFPNGAVMDKNGNIFVAEEGSHAIRKIDKNGNVTTLAGNGSAGYVDGKGAIARFQNPSGIAIDKNGLLYVADQFNNRIRTVTMDGVVATLAGTGVAGFFDAPGTLATFNRPVGLAVDGDGNVFVGDLFNHIIRKISASGAVATIAGTGAAGYADGKPRAAKFNYPAGLAIGPDNLLYIADSENHCIRRIEANGFVTTVAGASEGYRDGPADIALFRLPREIDIASDGTIYVADAHENRVRKID